MDAIEMYRNLSVWKKVLFWVLLIIVVSFIVLEIMWTGHLLWAIPLIQFPDPALLIFLSNSGWRLDGRLEDSSIGQVHEVKDKGGAEGIQGAWEGTQVMAWGLQESGHQEGRSDSKEKGRQSEKGNHGLWEGGYVLRWCVEIVAVPDP